MTVEKLKKEPVLSLVICVFNEEENIKPLLSKIYETLQQYNFEVIFVDDGSKDDTVKMIKSVYKKEIILVELKKNYGQSAALAAGIEQAKGKYIATLDGDLQNDPIDIPMMIEKLEKEDLDLVAGARKKRKDNILFRKIPSKIANFIIRKLTKVNIKDYGCTLKVFRKPIAKNLGLYGELHRFIPILASLDGADIGQMDVHHHPRKFGKSKYGMGRTFRVISDLMLMVFLKKYFQKPIHLFGGIGITLFIAGSIISLYFLYLKFLGQDIWGKPLLLLSVIFILAGIQLITMGIISELLIRIYFEAQRKKTYTIKRISIGKN